MEKQTSWLPALGRLLITALFLPGGLQKIGQSGGTIGYIASHGLPLPSVAYAIALIVEIPITILFLIGWQTRIMAVILGVYTVAAALMFHNNLADMGQMINFFKNLAIAGGLCSFAVYGGGTWSVDSWRSKR